MRLPALLAAAVLAAAFAAAAPASAQAWDCTSAGYDGACPASGYATPDYQYPRVFGSDGYNTDLQGNWWNCPSSYCGDPSANPVQLEADTPADGGTWAVTATQPAGNTAVNGYPDLQQVMTLSDNTGPLISSFRYLHSRFSVAQPDQPGDDYEAAYDIWLDNPACSSCHNEIMVWTDNYGQTPAGNVTAHATVYGVPMTVWADTNTVSFVYDTPVASGTVHIIELMDWLISHKYIPADTGFGLVDFGWEICSTHGVSETFTVNSYNLLGGCKTGQTCSG